MATFSYGIPPRHELALFIKIANIVRNRPQQIAQWVFAGSRGHDVLRCAIDLVATRFKQFNAAGERTIWNARETLKVTGPGVFTDCVMEYITAVGGGSLTDIRTRRIARIGDAVVLYVNAFAPFQMHSGGEEPDGFSRMYDIPEYMQHYISDLDIYVRHWFAGNWKASAASKSSSVSFSRKPITATLIRPWPWERLFGSVYRYPVVMVFAALMIGIGTLLVTKIQRQFRFSVMFHRNSLPVLHDVPRHTQ
eukprot:m.1424515 g.1424515  ORF g.1424515 m.1424515 type:complete len:250 (-) comp25061_c0_seq30:117-866(-)